MDTRKKFVGTKSLIELFDIVNTIREEINFKPSCIYCNRLHWKCDCLKKDSIEMERRARLANANLQLLRKKKAETAKAMAQRRKIRREAAMTKSKLLNKNKPKRATLFQEGDKFNPLSISSDSEEEEDDRSRTLTPSTEEYKQPSQMDV
jgi:hypothetical protein